MRFLHKNSNFSDFVAIALLYIGFGSSFKRGGREGSEQALVK
jgi:hypothetical protein